jgi:hypothetical protein
MKKQIVLLALVLVFCLSVPVAAAPTVDIPKGQIGLNLDFQNANDVDWIYYYDFSKGSISTVAATTSLTYGLTDDLAIIIGSQAFSSVDEWFSDFGDYYDIEDSISATDIKLQKKINKNMAVFVGSKKFKWDNTIAVTGSMYGTIPSSKSTSKVNGGLILNKELRKDVIGYASLGAGSGYSEIAAGFNLLLSEHFTLDFGYKSLSAKDIGPDILGLGPINKDISGSGFTFGLGLKF